MKSTWLVGITAYLMALFGSTQLLAQVPNHDFQEWDIYNNRDKPAEWFCPNIAAHYGPCTKIVNEKDLSVQVHNNMPCIGDDNRNSARGRGFIQTHFFLDPGTYNISYDLKIDSVIAPAQFNIAIIGVNNDVGRDTVWSVSYNDKIEGRLTYPLIADVAYDSLRIIVQSFGLRHEQSHDDCDLGYIAGTIDNIIIDAVVSSSDYPDNTISAYPNPFVEHIDILTAYAVRLIKVIDTFGREISSVNHSGMLSYRIDMSSVPSGQYIIIVVTDRGLHHIKVIKL